MSDAITREMLRAEAESGQVRVLGRLTTVGDLVDALQAFDRRLPVLVDGYEGGFQHPATPAIEHVERFDWGAGMFGEFAEGSHQDPIAVVLPRDVRIG